MTQILPKEPRQAVEEMLKLTEGLVELIESETNALATNDGTTFAMNEPTKEAAIASYEAAASEFHNRLEEFRDVDGALIAKLTTAQSSLKQSTNNNLKLLEKIDPENK